MWGQLVTDSLMRPRAAARRVMALAVAPETLVEAAVAVTCIGMLLAFVASTLTPGGVDTVTAALIRNPLMGAALQLGVMALIVVLTVRIGRAFGGTGSLWDALALIVWLNVVMVLIQIVQLVALVMLPPLAAVLAIMTLFWLLWAFANFVTELHDFENPLVVLGASMLAMVVLFFSFAMLLAILGLTPQGGG